MFSHHQNNNPVYHKIPLLSRFKRKKWLWLAKTYHSNYRNNGVWGRQLFEELARRVLPAPKAFDYFSIMKSNASPARASL
jgi:hypothetical protein